MVVEMPRPGHHSCFPYNRQMDTGALRRIDGGGVLAVGFGTAAAMWAFGYFVRLPFVQAPSPLVLLGMLALMLFGGAVLGRRAVLPTRTAMVAGILTMLVNMLILGSLLAGDDPAEFRRKAALWVLGALAFGAALGWLGAWLGLRAPRRTYSPYDWDARFAAVAAAATLMLILIGGLVTSNEAGLAVPDWPRSFGSNMFLYPLSRMTGGIYYEHAHRLFGALVGLTTLVLCIRLWVTETRPAVRGLAVAALVLVCVQGVMGGLRVTELSLALAVVHGVTAQLFLSLLLLLAASCSRRWRAMPAVRPPGGTTIDLRLAIMLWGVLVGQLALGALVRHTGRGIWSHIIVAAFVTLLAVVCGLRAWGRVSSPAPLPRLGLTLITVVGVQLGLGVAALAASAARGPSAPPTPYDVLFTTAHQLNGAVLMATTALLTVWTFRFTVGGRPPRAVDARPAA